MEELIKQLNLVNNEQELLETLLREILEGKDGKMTAAKIQAGRDIRFDLLKVAKELEK